MWIGGRPTDPTWQGAGAIQGLLLSVGSLVRRHQRRIKFAANADDRFVDSAEEQELEIAPHLGVPLGERLGLARYEPNLPNGSCFIAELPAGDAPGA